MSVITAPYWILGPHLDDVERKAAPATDPCSPGWLITSLSERVSTGGGTNRPPLLLPATPLLSPLSSCLPPSAPSLLCLCLPPSSCLLPCLPCYPSPVLPSCHRPVPLSWRRVSAPSTSSPDSPLLSRTSSWHQAEITAVDTVDHVRDGAGAARKTRRQAA